MMRSTGVFTLCPRVFGVCAALTVLLTVSSRANAQGALSAQGFGYPPGGLSARSLGTAGATGEFDYLSSRNPAAASEMGTSVLSVQGAPEWRTVSLGESSERSLLQRTSLVAAGLRIKRVGLLFSGTTLLDRSFVSESPGTAIIDGAVVPTTDGLEARGAMTEMRVSAGWTWKRVGVGVAAVAVTGEHNVVRARSFPDTLRFGNVLDSSRLGFQGIGAAVGVTWRPVNDLSVAASYRLGGPLDALRGGTTLSSANVPGRLGLGVLYQGGGTALALSVEQVSWSAMNGLGTEASLAQDVTNWSVGVEFPSGTLRRFPILWRAGYAQRGLPFLLGDASVSERGINGGVGVPLAGDFATLDLAVQRSQRSLSTGDSRENAWGLTAALTIRP